VVSVEGVSVVVRVAVVTVEAPIAAEGTVVGGRSGTSCGEGVTKDRYWLSTCQYLPNVSQR
jgi:hypothetical protein